jgi:hypothetical protein
MKRALTAVVLALSMTAWADDTYKTETKEEVKSGSDKAVRKVESKTTSDPDGLLNSTTDTSKKEDSVERKAGGGSVSTSEKTINHDAPGMKNDSKHKVKRKVTKDAAGNVVKDETESK